MNKSVVYADLSGSNALTLYIEETVNSLDAHHYEDILNIIQTFDPDKVIKFGNPPVRVPVKILYPFFGLSLSEEDIQELQEIKL